MSSALWTSKTGLAAQDVKMSIIANNLANVNTLVLKKIALHSLIYFMISNVSQEH